MALGSSDIRDKLFEEMKIALSPWPAEMGQLARAAPLFGEIYLLKTFQTTKIIPGQPPHLSKASAGPCLSVFDCKSICIPV